MGKGRAPTPIEMYLLKKKKKVPYSLASDNERAKNRAELKGISIEQAIIELKTKPLG